MIDFKNTETFIELYSQTHLGFCVVRHDWEAECLTNVSRTYVTVDNKGAVDLKMHVETQMFAECNSFSSEHLW